MNNAEVKAVQTMRANTSQAYTLIGLALESKSEESKKEYLKRAQESINDIGEWIIAFLKDAGILGK